MVRYLEPSSQKQSIAECSKALQMWEILNGNSRRSQVAPPPPTWTPIIKEAKHLNTKKFNLQVRATAVLPALGSLTG